MGQLNLFQAVIKANISPRILIIGSDEEYGHLHPDEIPATEESPLRPINPYGVSKVAQDLMGYQYFVSHGIQCIRVRPFIHIGPRQRDTFVISAFSKQIADAEAGLAPPVILVGNLEGRRDFSDVRDIVKGYHLALTKGQPGEVYNLGSGRTVQIHNMLDALIAESRIPLTVEQDPKRMRPAEAPARVADCSKANRELGWHPEIPLEQSLADVLEYWRSQLPHKETENNQ
jgi:GDP-4-dehydro-6-deoxy-D-mannose reductase